MAESPLLSNYCARREITLRLDAVVQMQDCGYFDANLHPYLGRLRWEVPLDEDGSRHFPFWVVYTKDMNNLIIAQAARFILPLEHMFQEA